MHRRYDKNNNNTPNNRRDFNTPTMEKLSRQNDIIIRLLKEIRDRLPQNQSVSEVIEEYVAQENGAEDLAQTEEHTTDEPHDSGEEHQELNAQHEPEESDETQSKEVIKDEA